jgi:branched-chain amino acid transport system permease protein
VGRVVFRRQGIKCKGQISHRGGDTAPRHIGLAEAPCLTVGCFPCPHCAGRDLLNDLIFVLTMLALAQYWNLLAGYAGLVSVGQQAFVGLGGYLLFALTLHAGLDPLVAILLAGLLAGALALPTALVVFRLRAPTSPSAHG